jgi:hypothetical protein
MGAPSAGAETQSIYTKAGAELRRVLEPGDLLLVLSNSVSGLAIAATLGGEHSHVAIWTGSKVLEATIPQVKEVELEDFVKGRVHVDVYRYDKASLEQRRRVVQALDEYRDKRYAEVDLALTIALTAVTAWLQTNVQPLKEPADWVRYNVLHWPAQIRKTTLLNKLRTLQMQLRSLWDESAAQELTCAALVVSSYLAAGLPIRVMLNPGAKLDLAQAVQGVLELLRVRARAAAAAPRSANSAAPSNSAESGPEAAPTDQSEHEALLASLDWLEALAIELSRQGAAVRAEHEISVEDAKRLVLEAGKDWPAGLVTPLQLRLSTDLKQQGERVLIEEPIVTSRPGPAGLPRK